MLVDFPSLVFKYPVCQTKTLTRVTKYKEISYIYL